MGVKFTKDTIEKPCRGFIGISKPVNGNKPKRKYIKKTMVKIIFKPDYEKLNQRKNLSEHPFGTIKRALNGSYFLLRNKIKTSGEFALFSLAYNFKRSQNLFGFNKLMALIG